MIMKSLIQHIVESKTLHQNVNIEEKLIVNKDYKDYNDELNVKLNAELDNIINEYINHVSDDPIPITSSDDLNIDITQDYTLNQEENIERSINKYLRKLKEEHGNEILADCIYNYSIKSSNNDTLLKYKSLFKEINGAGRWKDSYDEYLSWSLYGYDNYNYILFCINIPSENINYYYIIKLNKE